MEESALLEAPALGRATAATSSPVSHSAFIDIGWVFALACICAIAACLLSGSTIFLHLAHYAFPSLQKYVVRILLFAPVYAVSSLIILILPGQFVYIEALRDVWEAVVVYSFFCLILARCGGEDACASALSRDPGSIRHPQPIPFLLRLWRRLLRLRSPADFAPGPAPPGRPRRDGEGVGSGGAVVVVHSTALDKSSGSSPGRPASRASVERDGGDSAQAAAAPSEEPEGRGRATSFSAREGSRRDLYSVGGGRRQETQLVQCLGGDDSVLMCSEDLPTNLAFVKCCKRWILQFIFVKPAMAFGSLLVFGLGHYHSLGYQIPSLIIYNVSVCGALYALGLFYLATRKLPAMLDFHPVAKFFAMKLVIVATWYQAFFLGIIDGMTVRDVTKWSNWLLCVEMPLFALLNAYAYPVAEFLASAGGDDFRPSAFEGRSTAAGSANDGAAGTGKERPVVVQGVALGDVQAGATAKSGASAAAPDAHKAAFPAFSSSSTFSEVGGTVAARIDATLHVAASTIGRPFQGLSCVADPAAREVALRNVKDAVIMSDVVTDAYYNFHTKYNQHALLINEPPPETQSPRESVRDGSPFTSPRGLQEPADATAGRPSSRFSLSVPPREESGFSDVPLSSASSFPGMSLHLAPETAVSRLSSAPASCTSREETLQRERDEEFFALFPPFASSRETPRNHESERGLSGGGGLPSVPTLHPAPGAARPETA
ncbi:hypothetical protein BESB_025180 [Besnoitia besnoiti]|uniref:Transmembrane protein 184A n=1 Tax=Besnoitia besnoiti TaxID=94643 RepID=A0A2A9M833_BESBE|nr:uncharacterized protein BESB_025180 [Besnoitia besnoiti]PFH31552.1 hypothetical protein BESB_025180 [Besnoitia besnoiti]